VSRGSASRLRELFLAASDREPAAREAFLQEVCADDPALQAEVLALLGASPLPDRSVIEVLASHGRQSKPTVAGARFDRFQLLEHLGDGGMGTVDRAFDPQLQREVAIKRLRAEWLADPALVARFEREVQAAARLAVRGLCPVFETGVVEGVRYCVMPLVHGETLEARLRRTTALPTAAAIRTYVALFAKVAQALHRAHEAGLVHRDLKPANLMIQPDGEPMVLDFGLVQDLTTVDQRLTATGQLPGTPSYMAPEQVLGLPTDCRTDVHALGVMLFECVCGRRPFRGDSSVELFAQIERSPLPSPRRCNRAVPRSLAVVLAVATEKSPERRYRTAAQFAADLARVLAGEPVAARRQPPWRRVHDWAGRNRTAAATLFVMAAGLAVAVGLQLRRSALLDELRATITRELALRRSADDLRTTAEDRLADFDGLAALTRSAAAERAERLLYPAWPERSDALQAWLDQYGSAMAADRERVAATLARLHQRATVAPHDTTAEPPPDAATPTPPAGEPDLARLPASEQVLAAKLQQGLATLEQQLGPDGLRQRVQWNLAWARGIASWTMAHPHRRAEWSEAAAAIARADGVTASKRYAGARVALEPVLGFVPIGMNPATGLWEFYDLRSAFDPRRGGDPADLPIPRHNPDGSFDPDPDAGMVFVLLPGGRAELGAQRTDRAGKLYCATARTNESVRVGDVSPFFMSRFEMTEGQWQRLMSADPRRRERRASSHIDARHPVIHVSPKESEALLRDFGLRLPSEWEWEYACRAGTTTPWHSGEQRNSLQDCANIADRQFALATKAPPDGDLDDGFATLAPVGSKAGNDFGCHDMHGNVAEPCLEPDESVPGRRVLRGGSWLHNHEFARSAYRSSTGFDDRNEHIGVRPARSLH
jgi:formylglycine-generating enzyme required for sulfatase activity/tRNA A-37 threonylcarbamoyl transferase component Bud32